MIYGALRERVTSEEEGFLEPDERLPSISEGTFKGHSWSKKAFAEIKEVKDNVNPEKIPSALSDAVVFRYFASGQLHSYDKVNETTLTKQMIILHGLYGVPKIIPTIYFYGPYPYSMRETLEGTEELKESNIRHY